MYFFKLTYICSQYWRIARFDKNRTNACKHIVTTILAPIIMMKMTINKLISELMRFSNEI